MIELEQPTESPLEWFARTGHCYSCGQPGYDPDQDTVDDLFPGSGAVTRAVQHYQGVMA